MKSQRPNAGHRVTPDELIAALAHPDPVERAEVFERYGKRKPTIEAIPILRQALSDDYHATVKLAAHALGKLGPTARVAMDDLLAAAGRIDPVSEMPQAYPECVEAMAVIEPSHPELLPLIKRFVGLDNWVPISTSLRALKTIGTPEATELLQRTAAFWAPELSKTQRRVVDQLLES